MAGGLRRGRKNMAIFVLRQGDYAGACDTTLPLKYLILMGE